MHDDGLRAVLVAAEFFGQVAALGIHSHIVYLNIIDKIRIAVQVETESRHRDVTAAVFARHCKKRVIQYLHAETVVKPTGDVHFTAFKIGLSAVVDAFHIVGASVFITVYLYGVIGISVHIVVVKHQLEPVVEIYQLGIVRSRIIYGGIYQVALDVAVNILEPFTAQCAVGLFRGFLFVTDGDGEHPAVRYHVHILAYTFVEYRECRHVREPFLIFLYAVSICEELKERRVFRGVCIHAVKPVAEPAGLETEHVRVINYPADAVLPAEARIDRRTEIIVVERVVRTAFAKGAVFSLFVGDIVGGECSEHREFQRAVIVACRVDFALVPALVILESSEAVAPGNIAQRVQPGLQHCLRGGDVFLVVGGHGAFKGAFQQGNNLRVSGGAGGGIIVRWQALEQFCGEFVEFLCVGTAQSAFHELHPAVPAVVVFHG